MLGIAAGLLLLSKYTGVFLLFGIVAWLLASAEMRVWLKRREPYLAALIALILFSPVILWNAEHRWISFIKQFGRAFETSEGGLANMGAFIGTQAAFVSLLIFAFIVAGLAVDGIPCRRYSGCRARITGGVTIIPFCLFFRPLARCR